MKFALRGCVFAVATLAVAVCGKDYQADFPQELAAWQKSASSDKLTLSLSGQSLILENTAADYPFAALPRGLGSGAFEITMRFRVLAATDDRRVALIWEASPARYSYFELIDAGNYSVFAWTPAKWNTQRASIPAAPAKQGEFNELRVSWINGRTFYAVNGVTLDYHDMSAAPATDIGIRMAPHMKVEIASLSAREIPAADAAALAEKLTAEAAPHQKAARVVVNLTAPLPVPYVEEFDRNDAGWREQGEQVEIAFRDGGYEFENLSAEPNGLEWATKNLAHPLTGDFEISLALSHLEGAGEPKAGLVFDLDDTWARRVLALTRKGYHYYSYDGKAWRDDSAWGETPLVKGEADATNVIAFRVVGGRAYCLVNGTAVHAFDYPVMQRLKVGMHVASGTSVRFERMEVQPLTLTAAARAEEMRRRDSEARTERIAAGPKREEWVENFDDNKRDWTLDETPQFKSAMSNGELVYHHKEAGKGTHYYAKPVPINQVADYDLSLRARFLGGTAEELVALVWGNASDGSEHNRFCFFGDSTWYVYRRKGEDRQEIVKWKKTSALKPNGELNELLLRKVDDTYFFVINGQVLGDLPAFTVLGDRLGFEVGGGVHAAIDQIKLTYPMRSHAESVKEKEVLFKTLAANHAKKGMGTAYTVGLQREAEAQKVAAQEALRKETLEVDRIYGKYENKSFPRLVADRGLRNYVKRDGGIFYFPYKPIAGKPYFLKVICVYPDQNRRTDNDLHVVGIFLQEGPL